MGEVLPTKLMNCGAFRLSRSAASEKGDRDRTAGGPMKGWPGSASIQDTLFPFLRKRPAR